MAHGKSYIQGIIVGVFIIASDSDGDDSKAGTVTEKSKHKIEIRPDEAKIEILKLIS